MERAGGRHSPPTRSSAAVCSGMLLVRHTVCRVASPTCTVRLLKEKGEKEADVIPVFENTPRFCWVRSTVPWKLSR